MSASQPCGWCKCDPVRKGKVCCAVHNLIVCSGCKGTDSYINAHKEPDVPDITEDMDDEQIAAHNEAMANDRQYRDAVTYERNR